MTMYLPNRDVRPTGFEAGEFLELPIGPGEGTTVNPADAGPADPRVLFLEDLVEENASIAGDVVQMGEHLWGIHGYIPVDGDVLMGEFETREQATDALNQLPERTLRPDEL